MAEFNRSIAEEKNLQVDILSDPGNQVAGNYGLRHTLPAELSGLYQKFGIDLPKHNGDESWSLPLPARYVIDGSGVVRHADVNVDYTQRPDPAETLAILKGLE